MSARSWCRTAIYFLASSGTFGVTASNVSGYSDAADARFTVRWQIVDNASPATVKTITVRAIATRQAIGLQKEVTLTCLRAR